MHTGRAAGVCSGRQLVLAEGPMPRGRNRRGATLVLVALSMTAILGFAAMAVDLSQMGAYRSELQRAADAGAHAAAIQLTKTRYDSAAAIAISFVTANPVFGS